MSHPRREDVKGRSCSRGAVRAGGWAWGWTAAPERQARQGPQPATYLPGSEGHLAVLAFAQLSQLVKDGGQLIR